MSAIQAMLSGFDEYVEKMEVPAADALDVLLNLLKKGEADHFLALMKEDEGTGRQTLELMKRTFEEKPEWLEAQMRSQSIELRETYVDAARRKLSSVTAFVYVDQIERSKAEELNLAADTKHQLLEVSVVDEFLSRLPSGFQRSKSLSEWSVKEPSSEQADRYLSEACHCFLFMLDTACVVMCRSLLEEVLERRIPESLFAAEGLHRINDRTLGKLLNVVNNNLQELKLSADLPVLVRTVNHIASEAAHQKPVDLSAAFQCLKLTRKAILLLL